MPVYNYIWLIGPYLKSGYFTKAFSPDRIKDLVEEYRDSLGIGKNANFSADAFDNAVANRTKDFHVFAKTTDIVGVGIHDKLSKDDAKDVRDALNEVFTASDPDPFKQAQAEYNDKVSEFKKHIALVGTEYRVQDLIAYIQEIQADARKAIEVQQALEIQKLEAKFENADFKTKLSTVLGLTSDSDVDTVKNNMRNDLQSSHDKQLSDFNKSTSDSITKLHEAAAGEMHQFIFIANLYKNNKEMRQQIEKIARKKRIEHAGGEIPLTVGVGCTPDKISLAGITIDDLPTLQTITGRPMLKDPDGSFKVEMPNFWKKITSGSVTEMAYYQDPRQKAKSDMMSIAQAVRACGYDKIEMKVNEFKDPADAREMARQAYEACIANGFEPSKITISIDGKAIEAEKLFAAEKINADKQIPDASGRLKKCQEDAITIKAEFAELDKPAEKGNAAYVKDTLQNMKTKAAEAAQPNAAPKMGTT